MMSIVFVVVGKLIRTEQGTNLTYFIETEDLKKAKELGFEFYPAFKDLDKTHLNVLDAFMRRLPPRNRSDFDQYLENYRIKPNSEFSDFALLGYSGAKLPTDGFSIIHPFINAKNACEVLVEIAGYRFLNQEPDIIVIGDSVEFEHEEKNVVTNEPAIKIKVQDKKIGYVPRAMIDTFNDWLKNKRIENAFIEKMNGTADKPRAYIFIKISPINSET